MKVDICIPAYNEEAVIIPAAREVLNALAALPGVEGNLIVADNASTDATAKRAAEVPGVLVLSVPRKGKGAAVIATAKSSTGDYFGFIDADLSANPRDFKKLLTALVDGADIAIGSRLLDEGSVRRSLLRTLSSKIFNLLRKVFLDISVVDTQCGIKIMNTTGRKILTECEESGWFFDMEFLARAERAGLRIRELPVRWDEQRFAGRKSKLRVITDGFGALRAMVRIRVRLNRR